jgi:hypothetical protein
MRCVDDSSSAFIKWEEGDGRPDLTGSYRMVTRLVIDESLVPTDIHLFRIEGWNVAVIVSQVIKDALDEIPATGIAYQPVVHF